MVQVFIKKILVGAEIQPGDFSWARIRPGDFNGVKDSTRNL